MNLYHYEFKKEEIDCVCQKCVELNILENRSFMLLEEEEEEEEKKELEQRQMQRHLDIVSLRKDFDKLVLGVEIQAARLEAWRIQIEEFGQKKLSDLTFVKG